MQQDVKTSSIKADEPSEATGLPVLRTWRSVYVFVVMVFVLWVALLTLLGRTFS